MSLDVHRAILAPLKTALAAIPAQATPPISPVPAERVFYNRRDSNAPYPHVWLHVVSVAEGRPAMGGVEYTAFLQFEAWCRNLDEVDAIKKAAMKTIVSTKVAHYGSAYNITYSHNSDNIQTEEDSQHLIVVFGSTYLDSAVTA